jgi:hypothetical protein
VDWQLAKKGLILRSGGADGADSAFEEGADSVFSERFPTNKRIYLPWEGFNGKRGIVVGDDPDLQEAAATWHPAWPRLSNGAKKLHTRNVAQIFGYGNEQQKSEFVLCSFTKPFWTISSSTGSNPFPLGNELEST